MIAIRPPRASLWLFLAAAALPLPRSSGAQGIFSGELSQDLFGAAVQGAGDLNGDGFEDFAIGAPENDGEGSNAGKVYVYLGRAENVPGEPDLVLTAGDGGDRFGFSLGAVGRFNGDGFDDLAVGAPFSDAGGAERGRVYVFFGGDPMNDSPDLVLSGQQGGDHFGFALGGRFDFNGDSFDDLAVGTPDRPTNGTASGEVRIFYGGTSPSSSARVVLLGDQGQDQFGYSVHGAGNFNGDAFDDLVVGAPQSLALNPGKAYVVLGRSADTPPVRIILTGETSRDRFGWSVSGGGNFDGDAYDDVAVGAPGQDAGSLENGAAYVFRGGSGLDAEFDAKVGGQGSGDQLGTWVASDGDHDKDGDSDLLAGAPFSDDGGAQAGEMNLWLGGSPISTGSRQVFAGPRLVFGFAAGDHFGACVDFVDYNNDGHSELLGGAPDGNKANGDETGMASLTFFPGTLVPVEILDFTIVPAGDRVRLAWRVDDDASVLGFHVDRRGTALGDWLRLNASLLTPSRGGSYAYEDLDPVLAGGGYFEYRLVVVARDGTTDSFGPFGVLVEPSLKPLLGLSFPNPARLSATIRLSIPRAGPVRVGIFDAQGGRVRRLFEGHLPAGDRTLVWDGLNDRGEPSPSGTYFYEMETGGNRVSRKLILAR